MFLSALSTGTYPGMFHILPELKIQSDSIVLSWGWFTAKYLLMSEQECTCQTKTHKRIVRPCLGTFLTTVLVLIFTCVKWEWKQNIY